MTLIKEINDLRGELNIARTQVHDLEAALGVMRRTHGSGTADDSEKIISNQKNEIRKLRELIHDLENRTINRPLSGARVVFRQ